MPKTKAYVTSKPHAQEEGKFRVTEASQMGAYTVLHQSTFLAVQNPHGHEC
jgi:hypothetical protein